MPLSKEKCILRVNQQERLFLFHRPWYFFGLRLKMKAQHEWKIYRDAMSIKYEAEYQSWTSKKKKNWEHYLAGFWEGEGSMTVSFKEHKTCKVGYYIDPEVSLTQNVDGIHLLFWAKCCFKSGRVNLKSGSKDVWVYSLTNRRSIKENFIPFFEKHMFLWTGKQKTFEVFKDINERFERKEHHTLEGSKEIARLAYQMNSTKGKLWLCQRKRTLSQALSYMEQSYQDR